MPSYSHSLSTIRALVITMLLALPSAASAQLLDLQLENPLIFFNAGGTMSYNASSDQFSVTSVPLAIRLTPGSAPILIDAPSSLTINVTVDGTGAFTGGVPGPDFQVSGVVNGMQQVILEGEIDAFGYMNSSGTTDLFDFAFAVTGGTYAGDFASGRGAIDLTSEQSNFTGSFASNFSGFSKGTVGQVSSASACDLTLDKTCLVVSTGSTDLECTAKIVAFRVRYIGPSIAGVSTVAIAGGSGATSSHDVVLESGVTVLNNQNGFSIDATATNRDDLGSRTSIFINGAKEEIHTSCSAPFVAGQPAPLNDPKGDPSPNWLVEAFIDRDGNNVSLPDPQFADSCEIPAAGATECEQRPTAIAYRYTGGDCNDSANAQGSDKFECTDFGSAAGPVNIVVAKGTTVYANQTGVSAGDLVNANAPAGDDFDSEVIIEISDAGGNLLQRIRMHTSCSQPLRLGDRFGGMEIAGFTNDDQGTVQSGAEVRYRYEITNLGPDTALNLMVNDTGLNPTTVPGSPIASLDAGITEILEATVFVDGPVDGVATVSGTTAGGATCQAMDNAPVTVAVPPPCDVASAAFELKDDEIKWDLSNLGNSPATIESIEVSWPAQFEKIKEIKLDGDKIFETQVSGPTVTITNFIGDLADRQIDAGKTEEFKIKFTKKYQAAIADDIEIKIIFAEGCMVIFEPGMNAFGDCDGKLNELTMIWDGAVEPVNITAYAGSPGTAVVFNSGDIFVNDEVTVTGYNSTSAPNDVFWVIFDAAGNTVGQSKFHRSCSDSEMNGQEDCGLRQGNGKGNDSGFINDWILEGLMDEDSTLDCTP